MNQRLNPGTGLGQGVESFEGQTEEGFVAGCRGELLTHPKGMPEEPHTGEVGIISCRTDFQVALVRLTCREKLPLPRLRPLTVDQTTWEQIPTSPRGGGTEKLQGDFPTDLTAQRS